MSAVRWRDLASSMSRCYLGKGSRYSRVAFVCRRATSIHSSTKQPPQHRLFQPVSAVFNIPVSSLLGGAGCGAILQLLLGSPSYTMDHYERASNTNWQPPLYWTLLMPQTKARGESSHPCQHGAVDQRSPSESRKRPNQSAFIITVLRCCKGSLRRRAWKVTFPVAAFSNSAGAA